MERLRLDNEEAKKCTMGELAKLEDAMKLRDKEMEKLDEQVENKKNAGRSQDEEVNLTFLINCNFLGIWVYI